MASANGPKQEAPEVVKLQRHMALLREEYIKLQNKYVDMEQKYNAICAVSGHSNNSFVAKLLHTVADLFEKDIYSDIEICLKGHTIRAHKFVLAARSDNWGANVIDEVEQLDFSDISYTICHSLLKWVYTDRVDFPSDENQVLELTRVATRFQLGALVERCERNLISTVHLGNCLTLYAAAEEISLDNLKQHSLELISNHWNDFTSENFAEMSAPLLYNMFKSKSKCPLHMAIRMCREDVVFLFLIEFDAQLSTKLNEVDEQGDIPLDLALKGKQESIALSLIGHKADINTVDRHSATLLHKAIMRGDEFAASFLINNNAEVDTVVPSTRKTALHLAAAFCPDKTSQVVLSGMVNVAKQLLNRGADLNMQDSRGNTVLHEAILAKNEEVITLLVEKSKPQYDLCNEDGHTALWLALETMNLENGFARKLVTGGASPNSIYSNTGNSLLQHAIEVGNEKAALFLVSIGADLNHVNKLGESALHLSCAKAMSTVTTEMLKKGANPNLQTFQPPSASSSPKSIVGDGCDGVGEEDDEPVRNAVYHQTALHVAINHRNLQCVQAILDHKVYTQHNNDDMTVVVPNLNIRDSEDQTVLSLALLTGQHGAAQKLLAGGASINVVNRDGFTLLHQAIMYQETQSAIFLIEKGADITVKTLDDQTPLQLAVSRHLPRVVEELCVKGTDLNCVDKDGNCPLWCALESGQEDVASILVRHRCDADFWSSGPDGCQQTLLHRAIDESNESVACFLIRSGCNVDSPRRPGPHGEGGDEARDLQSPLHLSASWGLEKIVETLIEHGANINSQDVEGKSPLHVAINSQHHVIVSLLLSCPSVSLTMRDKHGQTPFAVAMTTRNNRAAEVILSHEPRAAEQFSDKGTNFLHVAIQKADLESVLFLISINANVNSRTKDSSQMTPLHLAIMSASEMIVRNLLLAGANVQDLTPQKQTALHLAAAGDQPVICSILLQNKVNFNALDANLNNALHIAVHKGHLNVIRVLLTESSIDALAVNSRGYNPLHVLAKYGKENAGVIFEFFLECMPDYPIDKPDAEGNTALLLAYMNGNANLCRAVVRAGACVGAFNKNGVSLFNHQVPTRQLLNRLLDLLNQEPPWTEGDACLECGAKFGLTTRKHHCRHCGRLLCYKCSDKHLPILKYNIQKPVRVCDVCYEVLMFGSATWSTS